MTTTPSPSLSIPLSSTHPQLQQPFKLLELPPDLLTLLESHDPPTLQITSHATPPHHAHLTTSTGKKYALRLKSSSNPISLVLPIAMRDGVQDGEENGVQDLDLDLDLNGREGNGAGKDERDLKCLTRISTVEETIELIEVREGDEARKLGRGNRWRERFGRGRV